MNVNDVALVTGGNKGIGREVVRQLAEQGLTVYLGARDPERGQSAVEELTSAALADSGGRRNGLDIRFARLDVTDVASVKAAVETIETATGRLDVLVNNAGIADEWGIPPADITAAHLREVYEVNVFGVVTVTSACVPLLRRSRNPRIVNMSSGLGSPTLLSDPDSPLPAQGLLAYGSSKAALNALTVIYANALRADGIRSTPPARGWCRPIRTPQRPSPAATAPQPTARSSRSSSRPSPPTAPPESSAGRTPWTTSSRGEAVGTRSMAGPPGASGRGGDHGPSPTTTVRWRCRSRGVCR